MYLGRFFTGEILPLVFQCADANGTPTVPSNAPYIDLRGSGGQITQVQMPVLDKPNTTGLFMYPLLLNSSFTTGRYSATYFANAGGYPNLEVDAFEVVAGGDSEGAVITQAFWSRPEASYLVQQTEAGSVLLKRGPTVS